MAATLTFCPSKGRADDADVPRNSAYGHCPRLPAPWLSKPAPPTHSRERYRRYRVRRIAGFRGAPILEFATEYKVEKLFAIRGHELPVRSSWRLRGRSAM